MSFSQTCTDIHLEGAILYARWIKAQGLDQVQFSINLDDHIGYKNGKLEVGGKDFSKSASAISLVPAATLSVTFKKEDGLASSVDDLNLDYCIKVDDGQLVWVNP